MARAGSTPSSSAPSAASSSRNRKRRHRNQTPTSIAAAESISALLAMNASQSENAAGGKPRVMLLAGPATYRSGAFLQAAARLDLDVVQVVDTPQVLLEKGQPT